jgi:hypothetical protein
MTEAEWLACNKPQRMLECLGDRATERRLRLFACACSRDSWGQEIEKVLEVVERYADGLATREEMSWTRTVAGVEESSVGCTEIGPILVSVGATGRGVRNQPVGRQDRTQAVEFDLHSTSAMVSQICPNRSGGIMRWTVENVAGDPACRRGRAHPAR